MKPGIYDLPFEQYLAASAYGSSDLRAFRHGPPAMVQWRREHRDGGTDSTRIGQASHCRILTPDLFDSVYAVRPAGMDFRSREGKDWRLEQQCAGLDILTHEEFEQVQQIHAAFEEKAPALDLFRRARGVEQSVFWTCAESGLPCKGRPDWFDDECVYDLKVSIHAEKGLDTLAFRAHASGWLNQLANNKAGLNANGIAVRKGRLVVVAPNPPQQHRVWLLEVRENDLDFLEMDNANTRRGMAVCHRSGEWPGTPDTWTVIELPASAAFTESDLEGAEEIPI